MSEVGWIKLYRKSKNNSLMTDFTAWGIFSWIMLSVDRATGEMTIGRFWASQYFSIPPATFYSALKRLEKKYKVISLRSNNKMTTVRVLSWAKYQEFDDVATTNQQQINNKSTHIQEVKNKEVKNIIINDKNSDEFSELKDSLNIPEQPVKGISHEFQAEGVRIHKALGAPKERLSAYFKAVKEESRRDILTAFAFADDHPEPKARDKMFFWKLSDLKKGVENGSVQPSN